MSSKKRSGNLLTMTRRVQDPPPVVHVTSGVSSSTTSLNTKHKKQKTVSSLQDDASSVSSQEITMLWKGSYYPVTLDDDLVAYSYQSKQFLHKPFSEWDAEDKEMGTLHVKCLLFEPHNTSDANERPKLCLSLQNSSGRYWTVQDDKLSFSNRPFQFDAVPWTRKGQKTAPKCFSLSWKGRFLSAKKNQGRLTVGVSKPGQSERFRFISPKKIVADIVPLLDDSSTGSKLKKSNKTNSSPPTSAAPPTGKQKKGKKNTDKKGKKTKKKTKKQKQKKSGNQDENDDDDFVAVQSKKVFSGMLSGPDAFIRRKYHQLIQVIMRNEALLPPIILRAESPAHGCPPTPAPKLSEMQDACQAISLSPPPIVAPLVFWPQRRAFWALFHRFWTRRTSQGRSSLFAGVHVQREKSVSFQDASKSAALILLEEEELMTFGKRVPMVAAKTTTKKKKKMKKEPKLIIRGVWKPLHYEMLERLHVEERTHLAHIQAQALQLALHQLYKIKD